MDGQVIEFPDLWFCPRHPGTPSPQNLLTKGPPYLNPGLTPSEPPHQRVATPATTMR